MKLCINFFHFPKAVVNAGSTTKVIKAHNDALKKYIAEHDANIAEYQSRIVELQSEIVKCISPEEAAELETVIESEEKELKEEINNRLKTIDEQIIHVIATPSNISGGDGAGMVVRGIINSIQEIESKDYKNGSIYQANSHLIYEDNHPISIDSIDAFCDYNQNRSGTSEIQIEAIVNAINQQPKHLLGNLKPINMEFVKPGGQLTNKKNRSVKIETAGSGEGVSTDLNEIREKMENGVYTLNPSKSEHAKEILRQMENYIYPPDVATKAKKTTTSKTTTSVMRYKNELPFITDLARTRSEHSRQRSANRRSISGDVLQLSRNSSSESNISDQQPTPSPESEIYLNATSIDPLNLSRSNTDIAASTNLSARLTSHHNSIDLQMSPPYASRTQSNSPLSFQLEKNDPVLNRLLKERKIAQIKAAEAEKKLQNYLQLNQYGPIKSSTQSSPSMLGSYPKSSPRLSSLTTYSSIDDENNSNSNNNTNNNTLDNTQELILTEAPELPKHWNQIKKDIREEYLASYKPKPENKENTTDASLRAISRTAYINDIKTEGLKPPHNSPAKDNSSVTSASALISPKTTGTMKINTEDLFTIPTELNNTRAQSDEAVAVIHSEQDNPNNDSPTSNDALLANRRNRSTSDTTKCRTPLRVASSSSFHLFQSASFQGLTNTNPSPENINRSSPDSSIVTTGTPPNNTPSNISNQSNALSPSTNTSHSSDSNSETKTPDKNSQTPVKSRLKKY